MSWITEINSQRLHIVAAALNQATKGRSVACPACQASKRGKNDRRLPAGIRPDGKGFRCHACGVSGDVADFACWALAGRRCREVGHYAAAVHQALSDAGLVHSADEHQQARQQAKPLPFKSPPQALQHMQQPAPSYLNADQIGEALQASSPDDHYFRWELRNRNIEPELVFGHGFRCLEYPIDGQYYWKNELPEWRRGPGGNWRTYWRLMCPLMDHTGNLRAYRGRHIATDPVQLGNRPKTVSPKGHTCRGLMMAGPVALEYLREQRRAPRIFIIAEGEFDFLAWSTKTMDLSIAEREDMAIFGIISGSWSDHWVKKLLLPGHQIWLRTDPDPAGDAYAATIERDAWSRGCRLLRDTCRDQGDDGDRWQAGASLQDMIKGHTSAAEVRALMMARLKQQQKWDSQK